MTLQNDALHLRNVNDSHTKAIPSHNRHHRSSSASMREDSLLLREDMICTMDVALRLVARCGGGDNDPHPPTKKAP